MFSAVIVASTASHCWGVRFRSCIFSFALLDNVKNRADVASIIIPEIYPTAEGLSEAIYIKVVMIKTANPAIAPQKLSQNAHFDCLSL